MSKFGSSSAACGSENTIGAVLGRLCGARRRRHEAIVIQTEVGLLESLRRLRAPKGSRKGRANRRVHVEFKILRELVELAVHVKPVPGSAHVAPAF
jgi:hypothetical protein